jgi:hypothetical protein
MCLVSNLLPLKLLSYCYFSILGFLDGFSGPFLLGFGGLNSHFHYPNDETKPSAHHHLWSTLSAKALPMLPLLIYLCG